MGPNNYAGEDFVTPAGLSTTMRVRLPAGRDDPQGATGRRVRWPEGPELEKTRSVFGQEFEHRKVRKKRVSTISAGAGGVVGGVVVMFAVDLRAGSRILLIDKSLKDRPSSRLRS